VLARRFGQGPRDERRPRLPGQLLKRRVVADTNLDGLPHEGGPFSLWANLLVREADRDLWIVGAGSAIVDEDRQHVGTSAEVKHVVAASIIVGGDANANLSVGVAQQVVTMGLILQEEVQSILWGTGSGPDVLVHRELVIASRPGGIACLLDPLLLMGPIGAQVRVTRVSETVGGQVIGVAARRIGQQTGLTIGIQPLIEPQVIHQAEPGGGGFGFLGFDAQA
jgi:hypothetical protein